MLWAVIIKGDMDLTPIKEQDPDIYVHLNEFKELMMTPSDSPPLCYIQHHIDLVPSSTLPHYTLSYWPQRIPMMKA